MSPSDRTRGSGGARAGGHGADRRPAPQGSPPHDGRPIRSSARPGDARPERHLSTSTLWAAEPGMSRPQPLAASWHPAPEESTPPEVEAPARARRPVRRFLRRYGWRAYAIPVLLVITALVVVEIVRQPGAPAARAAGAGVQAVTTVVSGVTTTMTVAATTTVEVTSTPAPGTTTAPTTAPDPNGSYDGIAAGALPAGAAFAVRGDGSWHVVPGTTPVVGTGPKRFTYTIEVENGIESAAADQEFASAVDATLADPRSWIGGGTFSLQRIDTGTPDFRISLTSQMTIRRPELCGWTVPLEASCYNQTVGRVMINDARWMRGAVSFNGDLGSYRVYAINHEVGHALGFHHQPCAENGGLAPVMMQQSWSTANDDLAKLDPNIPRNGKVCRFNAYPYPRGPEAASAAITTG